MKHFWYKKRDLLNKRFSNNVHKMPYISSILLHSSIKNISDNQLYLLACDISIMTEEIPYLTRIGKSKDKKLVGVFTGCKVLLKKEKAIEFFLRFSQELYPLPTVKKTNDKIFSLTLSSSFFEELEKFSSENFDPKEILVDFNLTNKISKSETSLLFSQWNLNN